MLKQRQEASSAKAAFKIDWAYVPAGGAGDGRRSAKQAEDMSVDALTRQMGGAHDVDPATAGTVVRHHSEFVSPGPCWPLPLPHHPPRLSGCVPCAPRPGDARGQRGALHSATRGEHGRVGQPCCAGKLGSSAGTSGGNRTQAYGGCGAGRWARACAELSGRRGHVQRWATAPSCLPCPCPVACAPCGVVARGNAPMRGASG